jgi:anti-sigma regulatory factor (Ser/Thr protein kinase)
VDELITNIIAHAYTDKEEHAVLLECRLNENTVDLELRDDGVPFDPTTQTRPNTQLAVEDRDIGGLGIHLVMTLMDKVEYQREGDFNVLKIIKILD